MNPCPKTLFIFKSTSYAVLRFLEFLSNHRQHNSPAVHTLLYELSALQPVTSRSAGTPLRNGTPFQEPRNLAIFPIKAGMLGASAVGMITLVNGELSHTASHT